MDESSKLSALQKAYAEIIMNVSKEAACRVTASEKKRSRLQQELSSVKDEGLRLLLRLKQMLNDKTNEAEATAISQRKRIDELESQLDEAENVVEELRGELREARAELTKMTSNRLSSSNRTTGAGTASTEMIEGNEIDAHKSYCRNSYVYAHDLEFPARVMEHEETEIYGSSLTQRIQAFRRKLYGQLSLSGKEDHLENRAHGRRGKNDELCRSPKLSPDQPFGMEEDPDELYVTETDGNDLLRELPKSFQRKRKRTTIYRKIRTPPSNDCFSRSSPESHHTLRLPVNTEQMCVQSERRIGGRHGEPVKPCSFRDKRDKSKLSIEARVTKHEKGPEEALVFSPTISDPGRSNDLSSHTKLSNLAGSVLEDRCSGKFLKYTFQRRRKTGKLSYSNGISTADQKIPKVEINEEHNGFRETDVFDQISESSGDTQLMEVAEQLITLSGRK